MTEVIISFIAIVGTVIIYAFSQKLYNKKPSPFTLPIFVATLIIAIILLVLRIPYDTYMIGGEWINKLLGPAVVSLAYPLYQQRETVKKLVIPILIGTLFGAVIGVSTGVYLAKWAGFEDVVIYALSPKSVTTPVSMAITDSLGGAIPLAPVFVMIAGIGGVMISPIIFKYCRINSHVGRGVGIGCASHAIGTATAMESSQLEGSISTISMVVSAILVSIITPGIIYLLM